MQTHFNLRKNCEPKINDCHLVFQAQDFYSFCRQRETWQSTPFSPSSYDIEGKESESYVDIDIDPYNIHFTDSIASPLLWNEDCPWPFSMDDEDSPQPGGQL